AAATALLVGAGVEPQLLLKPIAGLALTVWRRQEALAAATGWPWLDATALLSAQACAALAGAGLAWSVSGLPVLTAVGAVLAAAVLVQRPGGGELGPLFARLEESVTAIHEVTREADALGAQARSAAALILGLPLVFLGALSLLRSPYLDAYRQFPGQAFLGV